MILFTCDIDWASEEIIEYTLNLFEEQNIKCTIFATHKSGVLDSCDKELFEIGIHPNYNELLNSERNNPEEIVTELLAIYPNAKGVRAHSLLNSTPLLNLYAAKGLKYDMNLFLPYHTKMTPFKIWNGLIRVPYNWEDDLHLEYSNSLDNLNISLHETVIVDFHPIHVYLNTEKLSRYYAAKPDIGNHSELAKHINITSQPGTRNLLLSLFKSVKEMKLKTKKISEFIQDHEY